MDISSISELEILERVDEYSLYCFYLEFEPHIGAVYRSRIRTGDDVPSFGIYPRTKAKGDIEFMWKDQALHPKDSIIGKNYGDIFGLVQVLFTLPTRVDAVFKIASDIGLLEDYPVEKTLIKCEPVYNEPCNIRVKSRDFTSKDLEFWRQFNISEEILNQYNCTAIEYFFLTDKQVIPTYCKQGYAYRIHDKYQIYRPFEERKKKFRNDWTDYHIPGLSQLQGKDLCIVTKSYKDVMSLRSFGFDAVSPRAENVIPLPGMITYLQKRFKRVVTLFDNDGKESSHLYPFEHLYVPVDKAKDPTDYCKMYGPASTFELLNSLLYGNAYV